MLKGIHDDYIDSLNLEEMSPELLKSITSFLKQTLKSLEDNPENVYMNSTLAVDLSFNIVGTSRVSKGQLLELSEMKFYIGER